MKEALVSSFLESLQVQNYSPETIKSRLDSLFCFFKFLRRNGITDLREVGRPTIQNYQAWLLHHQSIGSVLVRLVALRRFFAYLESTDQILINPCQKMVLPKQPDRLPRAVLSKRQARQILRLPDTRRPKGIRDRALLELFYSSGLRLSEMTALQLQDLDLRNGLVRVNQGKGNRDRIVPIGKTACHWLGEYLKVRSGWLRTGRQLTDRLWLGAIAAHQSLKKEAVAATVRRYGKNAHAWRHGFATHLLNGGANIVQVQRLLGHRSIQTTEIYTRVTLGDVKKTFRKTHPRERIRNHAKV
jgi:integrase/recombinase XerD